MKTFRSILIIGYIEILIGLTTLFTTFSSVFAGYSTKSLNVLSFVIIAACISTSLGVGILKFQKTAYLLLLYFSSVVILSKILIFTDIIHINGALETSIPPLIKNSFSIIYHGLVICTLRDPDIRAIFFR